MTRRLIVDGADISAVIPRYENRLIDTEAFDGLLSRKRITALALCEEIGVHEKTLWRFRRRHRVLPIVTGWRITSALHCRIGDFTVQHHLARQEAVVNTILWDTRDVPQALLTSLLERLMERLQVEPPA